MKPPIETIRWRPPQGYELALEIMPISELYRRGSPEHFRLPQRVDFFTLIGVTQGSTEHVIDFVNYQAQAGTWLLLRPGQIQRFDFSRAWEGWLIAFRPDFIVPSENASFSPHHILSSQLEELGSGTLLTRDEHALCCAIVQQMRADAVMAAEAADRNALMLYQVCNLLLRLKLAQGQVQTTSESTAARQERVARFRKLVETEFLRRRDVPWYAERLGCAEKTLHRSTLAVTGITAKALITGRVVLEAKRQLVHTQQPVQTIADGLGFDEASNFVKFFKREVGCTPSQFRNGFL